MYPPFSWVLALSIEGRTRRTAPRRVPPIKCPIGHPRPSPSIDRQPHDDAAIMRLSILPLSQARPIPAAEGAM